MSASNINITVSKDDLVHFTSPSSTRRTGRLSSRLVYTVGKTASKSVVDDMHPMVISFIERVERENCLTYFRCEVVIYDTISDAIEDKKYHTYDVDFFDIRDAIAWCESTVRKEYRQQVGWQFQRKFMQLEDIPF